MNSKPSVCRSCPTHNKKLDESGSCGKCDKVVKETHFDFHAKMYVQTDERVISMKLWGNILEKNYENSEDLEESLTMDLTSQKMIIDCDGDIEDEDETLTIVQMRLDAPSTP
jgi:hypothetical protein